MPSNAYRGRMFTPAEVRRILRRAAELEDGAQPPRQAGRSHTIDEVEQIAGDAGIGAEALRQAMAGGEEPAPRPRHPFSLAGAPGRVSVERTVRGSVSAAHHGKLARAMRAAVGELGNAQVVGDSLSWSATTAGGRNVYAVVEPDGDGRVVIRVDENLRGLRGGLFGGIMGGMGGGGMSLIVALAAAVAPGAVPVAILLWAVVCYFIARTLYVNRFRARERELRPVVEQIAALVEAPGARVAAVNDEPAGARVSNVATRERAGEELEEEEDEAGRSRRAAQ